MEAWKFLPDRQNKILNWKKRGHTHGVNDACDLNLWIFNKCGLRRTAAEPYRTTHGGNTRFHVNTDKLAAKRKTGEPGFCNATIRIRRRLEPVPDIGSLAMQRMSGRGMTISCCNVSCSEGDRQTFLLLPSYFWRLNANTAGIRMNPSIFIWNIPKMFHRKRDCWENLEILTNTCE